MTVNPFPVLEIGYPLALCALFFLTYAAARGQRELRLAFAWLHLFALSGVFRILLAVIPQVAPLLSGAIFLTDLALVFALWWRTSKGHTRLRASDSYWLLLFAFLGARSFFPQFDVDSLLYHLNGIRYLAIRPELAAYQQHLEVGSLWYGWIGPEESLLAPVAKLDLAVAGGLLCGALKAFSVFSVIALVPPAAFLVRTLAVFLFLIDDHFFFSGQSRFVYLNPALIGILPLAMWLAARAWKRPERFALPAIFLGVMAAAIKMHGLFFLAGVLGCTAFAFARKRILPGLPAIHRALLSLTITGAGGFFLLKWFQQGSPLAPFDFLIWKADHAWREPTTLLALKGKASYQILHEAPWRALVFPGNLAMKAVAVLLLPCAVLLLLPKLRRRRLVFAVAFFAITALWAYLSRYLNAEESRYPRYVFGVAVLGLCCGGIFFFREAERRLFRIPVSLRVGASHLCALLLCARLILTIDTRYFNVPTGERPRWEHISRFVHSLGRVSSLSPRSPHMEGLYMKFMYDEVGPLETCIERLDDAVALKLGAGLLLVGPFSTWPMLLLSPGAVTGSLWEGGGYLRQTEGWEELSQRGIRFALLPKDPAFPVEARNRADKAVNLHTHGTLLCESPAMQLWRRD